MTWWQWILVALVGWFLAFMVAGVYVGINVKRAQRRQTSMNEFVKFIYEALQRETNGDH